MQYLRSRVRRADNYRTRVLACFGDCRCSNFIRSFLISSALPLLTRPAGQSSGIPATGFVPKSKTQDDAAALWHEMRRLGANARARDEFVFLQELRASSRGRKIRETERLVVDYKCRHGLD
jgi:hypothetical protein